MVTQEEQAAQALAAAVATADVALGQVTGWCEAIGRDAARRAGQGGAGARTDAGYLRAVAARGRLADAVRELQGAAEEFRQARDPAPAPRTSIG